MNQIKVCIKEFEFAGDCLKLNGMESKWNPKSGDLTELICIEAGFHIHAYPETHTGPPWLLGDWVSMAKIVRNICGRILADELESAKPNSDVKTMLDGLKDTLNKPENYVFSAKWEDIVRLLPIDWGRDRKDWQTYLNDPEERGERFKISPGEVGHGDYTSQSVPLLCKEVPSKEKNWIMLPNGIRECRDIYKNGIPTNLWRSLENDPEPFGGDR